MVRRSKSTKTSRRFHGGTPLIQTLKQYRDLINDNVKIDTKNDGYCDADCTPHVYYDQDPEFKKLGGHRKKSHRGGTNDDFYPLQMRPGLLNLSTKPNIDKYRDYLQKLNSNPLMRAEIKEGGKRSKRGTKRYKKKKSSKKRRLH
jgi:hypothetical protein